MNGNELMVLEVSLSIKRENFHKICRICLAEPEEASLINLFKIKFEEILLKDILEQLFRTKIIPNTELPQNLCQKCVLEVIRCFNFKKTYDTSSQILQALILSNVNESCGELCNDETNGFSSAEECYDELGFDEIKLEQEDASELIDSESNELPKTNPAEQLIQFEHKNNSTEENFSHDLTDDETDDQSEKRNLYTSTILKSDRADPTIGEILSREDDASTSTDKVGEDPRIAEATRYRCQCGETFVLKSEFNQHKKINKHKSSRKTYFCKLCNRFFYNYYYAKHLLSHSKEKQFVCEICSDRFAYLPNLRRHVRTRHNGEKAHVCEICGKSYTTMFVLRVHRRTHTGEKPFLCEICGKGFISQASLDQHSHQDVVNDVGNVNRGSVKRRFNYKLSGKEVACAQCHKIFSSKYSLTQHMVFHGEKNFFCSYCDKSFHTKATLESHTLVHTGVKAFSCDICSKRFAQSSTLATHKRMHLGLKPHSCKFCSKTFRQSSHLYTHIKSMHTDERPFVCEFCSKGFLNSRTLTIHERIHTGEKPFVCDLCSKAFHDPSTMKKHRRRHFRSSMDQKAAETT